MHDLKTKLKEVINIVYEEHYPIQGDEAQERPRSPGSLELGCAAGRSQLVIDAHGKVFPCPFLHEHPAGDLTHQSLEEIWNDAEILESFRRIRPAELKGGCTSCQYLGNGCKGGCRASAYAFTGDLWAEDPLCWHINGVKD